MFMKDKEYLKSILFGIEDSLVSTTGFVVGISIASQNKSFIFVAGLTAIIIEGVSMGVGEYLSDDALEELSKFKHHPKEPLISGILLATSYCIAGLIPFIPMIFLPLPYSVATCIALALISLFLLGYFKGKLIHTSPVRGGLKILVVGGITALLGIMVGLVFKI